MDLNTLLEEFADSVANRVIQRLKEAGVSLSADPLPYTKPLDIEQFEDGSIKFIPEYIENKLPPVSFPAPKKQTSGVERRANLSKIDIRVLRKKLARVEGKDVSDYSDLDKKTLVESAWSLETLIGRTLDEEIDRLDNLPVPDDTEVDDSEPEDDTEIGELSKEEAEQLDLAALKRYAVFHGILEDDLRGKDIEAVVELLYGSQPVRSAPEAPEEAPDDVDTDEEQVVEYTEEDIEDMSLGELRNLASELRIEYTRESKANELRRLILAKLK